MKARTETNGSEPVRVLLTGECDGLAELAETMASQPELELVGSGGPVGEAVELLRERCPVVCLHATRGPELPHDELALLREHTQVPIVLLASGDASLLLEQALAADIEDVLPLPQLTENVVFAIRKARRAPRRAQDEEDTLKRGRVYTVFAPKGGTGKSVVATNLAASLAKHERKRTLLLDLDLQFGDAAIMLGLEPDKTIYDLVAAPGALDSDKLAGYTRRHSSGLDVLAAPLRPEDAELVTEAKVVRLLEVARESYDAIVVDTSPFFHGPMLATLDQTDELLLLCGLDVPTLKNVRLALQTLSLLSFPADRIRLVLNQAQPKRTVKKGEIEGALELAVRFEVPYDQGVPAAVNRGAPPVLQGSARFAAAIREMGAALLPGTAKPRRGRALSLGRRNGKPTDSKRSRFAALGRA